MEVQQLGELVIHKTITICPSCFRKLSGQYMIRDDKVYLQRYCPEHGQISSLIDNNVNEYKDLLEFYQKNQISRNSQRLKELCIFVTDKCNLGCPICINRSEPENTTMLDLAQIEQILRKFPKTYINILGGEPTLYPCLEQLIKLIKGCGSIPVLFTNGIRLANDSYVARLKHFGIKKVSLQFDGSPEAHQSIRGNRNVYYKKLSAMENLHKHHIDTFLDVILEEGVNQDQIMDILQYGLKFNNIISVNFRSCYRLGKGLHSEPISLNEMIKFAEASTQGLISKDKLNLFQKLLYILPKHFSPLTSCFKHRYYILIRRNNQYRDLFDYLDYNKLNDFVGHLRNKKWSRILWAQCIWHGLTVRGAGLFFEIIFQRLMKLLLGEGGIKTRNILTIDFGASCDLETYDEYDGCGSSVIDINGMFSESMNWSNVLREKGFRGRVK